jgi:glycosyltransferase involved in cell wall biosynthesis
MLAAQLPKISLVLPSYNQGRYLQACLDSLFVQEYPDLELIVMDGGSKDESVAILERHAERFAYWQSQPDGGQPRAINQGFARASGQLFTWLNSDDILLPGALHAIARHWQAHPELDVLYGDQVDLDADGAVVDRYFHPPYWHALAWRTVPYIAQQGTVFTAALWQRVGGVDPELHCMFDHELWMRFMSAGARFGHVDAVVGGFRRHSESKGSSWLEIYAREKRIVAERYAAQRGSVLQRKVARGLFMGLQALNGNYARSLVFRLGNQRRLRRYQP